jgi:ATP-dependent helicase/nuclease subunit A
VKTKASPPTPPANATPKAQGLQPLGYERASARHPNRLIRASAGTGKTFQLAHEFIARLRDAEPERILASTFTKKAAAEILERILRTLADAALDDAALDKLADQLPGPRLTHSQCLDLLASLTRQLHRVRIGTLDSFFIQLAQSFSLELGLPPAWRIADNLEQDQLRTRSLEQLLVDQQQGDVVRLMHLLARGDASRSVTSLLRRAVEEFYWAYRGTGQPAWERVPHPPLASAEELQAAYSQLEAYVVDLRERHPKWKNGHNAIDDTLDAIDDDDWEAFLGITLVQKVADGEAQYDRKPIPPEIRAAYETLLRHAKGMVLKQLSEQTAGTWDLLDRYHRVLAALQDEAHASTFTDVARALADGWEQLRPELLEYRLDAGIDHLLLDEFQDTSLLQWSVLRPLAERVVKGDGRSFFCVGDPKQSIYGWRGGVAALFDALQSQLGDLPSESLLKSFRSSPPVIETVNKVFRGIRNHPNLQEAEDTVAAWVAQYEEHSTNWTDANRPGCVALEVASGCDWDAVLELTARRVAELHAEAPAATIGVLTRTNKKVGEIARTLRQRGVPASEEGGNAPTDCVGVQLLLALLQFADHPGDTAARYCIANSVLGPALGLSESSTDEEVDHLTATLRRRLVEEGYGRCLDEWARLVAPHCDPRGVARLRQLVDLAQGYEEHATLRPTDFVESVEVQRLEQPTAAPVRVMTVHQSKGLQFDVVVLPELDYKLVPTTPDFVTGSPSPVDSPDTVIRYRNKQIQSLLPDDLQQVFHDCHAATVQGSLCLMYVALTRAVHAMHLLVPATKGNEKTMGLTFANLIRAALLEGKPLEADTVPYRCGDADWIEKVLRLAEGRGTRDEGRDSFSPGPAGRAPVAIRLAPPVAGGIRGLERIAPSRGRPRGLRLSQFIRPANSAAMTRGSLLHAWLERITWLNPGFPDDRDVRDLRRIANQLGADAALFDASLADFRTMLARPEIAALLAPPAAADSPFPPSIRDELAVGDVETEVRNERRVAVPHDGKLIRGTIDRLVLHRRAGRVIAAEVIDYKTDVLDGADPARLADKLGKYRDQLRLYTQAVATIYDLPIERVASRLVLLGTGRIETVT